MAFEVSTKHVPTKAGNFLTGEVDVLPRHFHYWKEMMGFNGVEETYMQCYSHFELCYLELYDELARILFHGLDKDNVLYPKHQDNSTEAKEGGKEGELEVEGKKLRPDSAFKQCMKMLMLTNDMNNTQDQEEVKPQRRRRGIFRRLRKGMANIGRRIRRTFLQCFRPIPSE